MSHRRRAYPVKFPRWSLAKLRKSSLIVKENATTVWVKVNDRIISRHKTKHLDP